MTSETLLARRILRNAGGSIEGPAALTFSRGRIAAVEAADAAGTPDHFAMPCLVNAHDHARPVRSSSFGAGGKPLEIWLHYLALLPALDPYAATATSLARSALGGCGVVMIHHTRVQGLTDLPTEATEMARAARDVGVKAGFAVALKDRNPLVYGPSAPLLASLSPQARAIVETRLVRAPMSIAEQIALVDAVADAAHSSDFVVQYGPTGVQWCSPDLLRAVAQASERTGRRIHMHCLETRYQRDWADREFADGMLPFLDRIGLLSERLTLAHCTYARPAELDLLAQRGVTIAVNTSSNLGIRSGIAPVADMIRRGCRVAMGLDGLALDEDDDALREFRLVERLHAGTGFDEAISREELLALAFKNGRFAVLGQDDGGIIAVDQPADLVVLDWAKVDDDHLRDDVDPLDLLLARSCSKHICKLVVAGRTVVCDGEVITIDVDAQREPVLETIRAAIAKDGDMRTMLAQLETPLRTHFGRSNSCC